MVYFTDHPDPKENCLVILRDKEQSINHGIILPVGRPIYGDFRESQPPVEKSNFLSKWSNEGFLGPNTSLKAWFLDSPIHNHMPNNNPLSTLGRRIIADDKVLWGTVLKIHGEFSWIKFYWEWLEVIVFRNDKVLKKTRLLDAVMASMYTYDRNIDIVRAFCEAWCPLTNTLHTSSGELSITLWDLWRLGGLTIKGRFYDEVIPCAKELLASPEREEEQCPKSCEHLFAAYYNIASEQVDRSHISINSWVSFWFKGDLKYVKPPSRKSKKSKRPYPTHNPSGVSISHHHWSEKEKALFEELDIETDMQDKTYLAAFLSCWLCVFVFPTKQDSIRPAVFKVACLMAEGYMFSLAIPVLANIYRGLAQFSEASSPIGSSKACLPLHYVHGWLALYFDTHFKVPKLVKGPMMVEFSGESGAKYFTDFEARVHIHKGRQISWYASLLARNKGERLTDDKSLTFWSSSFFISLRSCLLSSRSGSTLVVEAYNPCRFSRQFGFCQDIPNDLSKVIPRATLNNVLLLWMICVEVETSSQVYIPVHAMNPHNQVTERYHNWWSVKNGSYLEDNIQMLVNSVAPIPSKPKFPKAVGDDKGGKQIRMFDPANFATTENEESHSSHTDRHWKRQKKSHKLSIFDDDFFEGVPSASQFQDLPLTLSPLDDSIMEAVEQTSPKSVVSPELFHSMTARVGQFKAPMNKARFPPSIPTTDKVIKSSREKTQCREMPTLKDTSQLIGEKRLGETSQLREMSQLGKTLSSKEPTLHLGGVSVPDASEISHCCANTDLLNVNKETALVLWEKNTPKDCRYSV